MIVIKIIALMMLVLILIYISIWYNSTGKIPMFSSFKNSIRLMVLDVKSLSDAIYERRHNNGVRSFLSCWYFERIKRAFSVYLERKKRFDEIYILSKETCDKPAEKPNKKTNKWAKMAIGMIETGPNEGDYVVVKNGERVSGKEAVEIKEELEKQIRYMPFFSRGKIYHINGKKLCSQTQKGSNGHWQVSLFSWVGENTDEILPTIKALGLNVERFLYIEREYKKDRQIEFEKNIYFAIVVAAAVAVLVGLVCVVVS